MSTDNDGRFPGQVCDDETGLYYNWHRYYSPQLGMYYQADPLGLQGGDYNLYRYANGSPTRFIDPYGLYLMDDLLAANDMLLSFSDPSRLIVGEIIGRLVSQLPASVREGRIFGTGYGEEAVDYWAYKYNDDCNRWYHKAYYGIMGSTRHGPGCLDSLAAWLRWIRFLSSGRLGLKICFNRCHVKQG